MVYNIGEEAIKAGVYRWSDGRKFEGQWAHNRTTLALVLDFGISTYFLQSCLTKRATSLLPGCTEKDFLLGLWVPHS